jgi:hypothetical protein
MMRRVRGIGFLAAVSIPAMVLLAGCGGDGEGDTCGRAADCQNGLRCVEGGCALAASTDTGGVYIDPVTNLEWQRAPTGGNMDWESAVMHCQDLSLDGTGWRLPSIGELRTLFRGCPATETGGACAVTDDCLSWDTDGCYNEACAGCELDAGPAGGCYWPEELGGSCEPFYWSSSTAEATVDTVYDGAGWYVIFSFGHVCARSKDFNFGPARCVR